jgi:hypothetical protein
VGNLFGQHLWNRVVGADNASSTYSALCILWEYIYLLLEAYFYDRDATEKQCKIMNITRGQNHAASIRHHASGQTERSIVKLIKSVSSTIRVFGPAKALHLSLDIIIPFF